MLFYIVKTKNNRKNREIPVLSRENTENPRFQKQTSSGNPSMNIYWYISLK